MFVMDGLAFASEPKASMKVLDAKAVMAYRDSSFSPQEENAFSTRPS